MQPNWVIRKATEQDLPRITDIYNQGIEDRIATLEVQIKTVKEMSQWLKERSGRYTVLVITDGQDIQGWASLNPYSHRCAYAGVADISIYIDRNWRGKGLGSKLLQALEKKAKDNGFHKLVLFTFPFNPGQGLYRKAGFREVGIFKNQGKLDGQFVDVMAMEKLLDDLEEKRANFFNVLPE
ncbi:arsinothricin resistance N-acetyltransferase ArsN1 family A [Thermoflavimicrobium dichotomicum]|uniref:Phosphinothricin acetyltransferase n=1 Tax=Thermoflavimicrobium dichotomicum TaxID=46223 RepID=A0A1I3LAV5_9BACL|nr:arsinothricin resistance N-acetyltransferase ArsN1 family A [Thermoflavimicrobium dichotomicum]SFI81893.1 phosphinothricin acetyltransferase [Thermoflavimicrobium dichotomicum]